MRGGHGGRISGGDVESQREKNASAPQIDHLLSRIGDLFRPYRMQLTITIILVLVSAGLSVAPPLLTRQLFDQGLFPPSHSPNVPLLVTLVVIMVALWVASAGLGVWQTWLTATVGNKVMGALRMRLFTQLQSMEVAFFTRHHTAAI